MRLERTTNWLKGIASTEKIQEVASKRFTEIPPKHPSYINGLAVYFTEIWKRRIEGMKKAISGRAVVFLAVVLAPIALVGCLSPEQPRPRYLEITLVPMLETSPIDADSFLLATEQAAQVAETDWGLTIDIIDTRTRKAEASQESHCSVVFLSPANFLAYSNWGSYQAIGLATRNPTCLIGLRISALADDHELLVSTLVHEIGHLSGLPDNDDPESIMHRYAFPKQRPIFNSNAVQAP
ncbi:MAG: hypothetical protein R3332_00495 [Pseudohongiellaceae bacterium]|nr:hypothetical protein [Pseudohongiellaceae bacterium]